jgi:hypothetical protein
VVGQRERQPADDRPLQQRGPDVGARLADGLDDDLLDTGPPPPVADLVDGPLHDGGAVEHEEDGQDEADEVAGDGAGGRGDHLGRHPEADLEGLEGVLGPLRQAQVPRRLSDAVRPLLEPGGGRRPLALQDLGLRLQVVEDGVDEHPGHTGEGEAGEEQGDHLRHEARHPGDGRLQQDGDERRRDPPADHPVRGDEDVAEDEGTEQGGDQEDGRRRREPHGDAATPRTPGPPSPWTVPTVGVPLRSQVGSGNPP